MKKRHSILAFILVLLSACTYYYVSYSYLPTKIEKHIVQSFEASGFEQFKFDQIKTEGSQTVISDIVLDKEGFSTIKRIKIEFSALKFLVFSNYANEMTVSGLNLTGDLSERFHPTITGWQADASFIDMFRNIPARVVTIEDSTLNFLSDIFGGIRVEYDVQIHPFKKNGPTIKGRFKSKQKKISFQSKLGGFITRDGQIELESEINSFSLVLDNTEIKRSHGGAKFLYDFEQNQFSSILEINTASLGWNNFPLKDAQINWEQSPEKNRILASGSVFGPEDILWSAKMDLEKDITRSEITITPDNIIDFNSFLVRNKKVANEVNFPGFFLNTQNPKISVNLNQYQNTLMAGSFSLLLNNPGISIEGSFSPNTENNEIKGEVFIENYRLQPTFQNDKEGLNTYFDISSSGDFELKPSGEGSNEAPKFRWSTEVTLDNSQIDYGALRFSNIQGVFEYDSENPKKTKDRLTFKLPLKSKTDQDGSIRLNIHDPERTFFNDIRLGIYGGSIKTNGDLFSNGALNTKNTLAISNINLKQLFKDAGLKDIFITAQLGGIIPFEAKDDKINVNGAILQSEGSGKIILPKYMIDALFPGNTKKLKLIRESLKNYNYEYFEIRLDGDLAGRVLMTLNARGHNPDFRNHEPVDLSLQIETQISLLFKNLLNR